MKHINYIKGDATQPIGEGNKIIVHVCNDIGGWGKGFVLAISRKWKLPEKEYRKWYRLENNLLLGEVQYVKVEEHIWIANLIGQHKIRTNKEGIPPIRYEAIKKGLSNVFEKSKELEATVHMPRIGCGLAGGKWEIVEQIINEELIVKEREVTVYDFE